MSKKSLTVIPQIDFTTARNHAIAANKSAEQAVWHALQCGLELLRLKASLGVSQGKRTDLSHDGTSWDETVQKEVGITKSTAHRWMFMAKGALKHVEIAPDEWIALPEPKKEKAISKLQKLAEQADSQLDFINQLYGIKPPIGWTLEGDDIERKHIKERNRRRTQEEIEYEKFVNLAKAKLTTLAKTLSTVIALQSPRKERAWDILSDDDLKKLKPLVHDLHAGLVATEDRRKATGRIS